MRFDRSAGIFCHVTSLPSDHGIGDLGEGAEAFCSFLGDAGVGHWQICPIGPTMDAAGESPYQSPSAFAGNPLLIDLDGLVADGWLDESDLEPVPDFPRDRVDYGAVREYKLPLLRTAFDRFDASKSAEEAAELDAFREREPWLADYALFRALSDARPEGTWAEWPEPLRTREPDALAAARVEHATEIRFTEFVQWTFDRQWRDLREAAADEGVSIVGDVPIYVALDSADVWANPEAFHLDDQNRPAAVAGVPPNAGDDGQRWGNPVYDWEQLAARDYDWWMARFRRLFDLADVARLDHFLGFVKYWAIPADGDPADGEWRDGPGRDLFEAVEREFGKAPFIAEDLGFEEPAMDELMAEFGFPGMRVPQYANWCAEGDQYQPMHYPEGVVGYTSTHDTDTWVGYFEDLPERQRDCFRFNVGAEGDRGVEWEIIDEVWGSEAVLAMTTLQDLLGLDSGARFNEPGTLDGNWDWRVRRDALADDLADRLWELGGQHVR
ncbi:4-alpha-glucanotransferase [Halorubrum aidingense JCM 13560]|uniref:4-alpha-glucanotransferase n=1 Tax=Halorubrum aidingense JCM 13560 TaxID=1230454 RepID=M0PDQ4_9EURY|nr:4-alpha-glucanotransferase [Halorubrum aidingense]EMA68267.1 4-alpha-glucanotransferase [Halorubrum aidingense JCM 13560]